MLFIREDCSSLGQTSRHRIALSVLAAFSGLFLAQPVLAANITIASPVNGTTVPSPVWVRAHNVGCDGLSPTAFGYSVDSSSTLTKGVTVNDIDTTTAIAAGSHTIHYKAWTSKGVCPVVSTTFKVAGGSSSGGSTSGGSTSGGSTSSGSGSAAYALPSNAMVYPAKTPSYDDAREFYMTYSDHGGERWHVSFGNNGTATNFVLDTYVYLVEPSQVQNLEMDMNQVMSNGKTVIYGTQCSSISKTWEYATISGSSAHWKSSNIGCNPLNWSAKTWHHIQVGFHRNSSGVVTHDWVNLDNTHSVFKNATGAADQSLGWAKGDLLVNFQIDGENKGSGSITSYIHKLTIYHW
jgi:hypothetical protein